MSGTVRLERVHIPARDGYELGGTVYYASEPRSVAVISGATAVPHRFNGKFAEALAEAGWTAVTYDYRGIGASRRGPLPGFTATMSDWALLDMSGVIDWVLGEFEVERTSLVGHSIGGQVAGLYDAPQRIERMVAVSAQSGHWRYQGGEQKILVAAHVYLSLPLFARTLGCVPWSRVASGEDLPAGVALQWARWCRDREYLFSDRDLPIDRYQSFTAPVLAYSFDDDKWGTERSVDIFMSHYPNVERVHVRPADHGIDNIGHMGFFRPTAAQLWDETITWLARGAG